ncbi:flagellar filament capping protein FliD [Paenibacillus mendelii]|uniref:Flagellar hook-associated protein 2 n=1 Tax=Paenibacillus mendelii TaxID=206163 RepID=A0ABV6J3E7_9BACL|nr:flagellar filament capping protein FliD [Paenibacillus mendelii]MCQ6563565.1 flagellar filament capping protein FliD [Paenibacillus mendelii]
MSSMLRISGFNSGLDIDTMVKTMMKAERAKLDKLVKNQTSITWKQEAYRDVSTSLVDFRNNKLDKYNKIPEMTAKKAEVSGNTAAVSITSANSTATGSMSVTVEKLASAARGVFQLDGTQTMGEQGLYDTGKFTINDIEVSYESTDKIADIVNKINANKGLNVTAMYSGGILSITNNKTGAGTIELGGDFEIKPADSIPPPRISVVESIAGNKAMYTVNGLAMTSDSNNVSVNGVNLQLKAKSTEASVITTSVDTDKIMNTIKSFITDYNAILDQVNGKLEEKRYRSYLPLTTEEKTDMSDKQVELWEEKARSGLLGRDSILSSMVNDLRTAVITDIDLGGGKKINITQLGIGTGKWTDRGKLVIENEDKLRAAIENDLDSVVKLFTQNGAGKPEPTSTDTGIFNKMSATVMTSLQMISDKAGTSSFSTDKKGTFMASSMLGEELQGIEKRINAMNDLLQRKENQYYAKFTAMETAMNRYSSQSSAFSMYS